jgi:dienelactone hydrolase
MTGRELLTGLLALGVLVAACGDSDDSSSSDATDPATESPDDGPTSAPTTGATSRGADDVDAGSAPSDCTPASDELAAETITVTTTDEKAIVGTVHRPAAGTCLPAVLLVHQYMRDRWQWSDLPEQLAARGYLVLAIDLRGHGDSDEQDGYLPEVLTDPDQAPLDVHAALDWLRARDDVDPGRIGIVGTSIGAYLAGVAVVLEWGAGSVVAISPLTEAIQGLARHHEAVVLSDVYCIATSGDSDGAQARSCEQLVEAATGRTRIEIFDTADHGVEILERQPELAIPIIEWLDETL